MCSTLIIFKIISLLIRPLVFIVSNLFENLTMLSNFFKVNENIQVLDPLTKIWEGATIKGFKSSWEVAVRYQRWFKNGTIKIPDELAECRKKWPIRKCITHAAGPLQPGSRRAATAQGSLSSIEENRMVHERVFFVGESVRSFTDLSSKERKKDRVNDRRDEEVVRWQSRNSVDGNFFFQNPNLKLKDFSEINLFFTF